MDTGATGNVTSAGAAAGDTTGAGGPVRTSSGPVRGTVADGVVAFLGIPYAAAPVGELQFAAPQPAPAWTEVRAAVEPGPTCPQEPYPAPIAALLGTHIHPGDESLNLSVWTPERSLRSDPGSDPAGSGLPVMVWIHGGAFTRGANRIPIYDGTAFARDGVVLVGVNYRLGVWGFSPFPDAPDNRGLLDQIAALRWVRDNIARFGGDPDNVTVFGESAGAMTISNLLVSPAAQGLFQRAIVQSGSNAVVADRTDAAKVTAEIAAALGVEPTAAAFAGLDADAILAAQSATGLAMIGDLRPERWGATVVTSGLGITHILPTYGDEVVPRPPADAAHPAEVGLMIGTNREEFRLFTVPYGVLAGITDELLPAVLQRYGLDPADGPRVAAALPDASAGDVFAAILTERAFVDPARRDAAVHAATGAATYVYDFDWSSGVPGLGACHALELPFVFDTLADSHELAGPNPPQALADEVHAAWVRFAKTGDPGWASYTGDGGAVHRFG